MSIKAMVSVAGWLEGLVAAGFVRAPALDRVHVARGMDEALDAVETFG